MFGLLLAPLIEKLAGSGLKKIAEVVTHKGADFIKEKTGIDLSEPEKITPQQLQKLQQFEDKDADRWLEDIKSARNMYQTTDHQTADHIAKGIMHWNLVYIVILVATNLGAVAYFKDQGELIAIITAPISMAIQQLFSERQAVTGFHFGSSKSSKDKTDMLARK